GFRACGFLPGLVLRPRWGQQPLGVTAAVVVPSRFLTAVAPQSSNFAAQSPGLHVPLSTLRHALAGRRRMTRGRRGSLALRRTALPSPPPYRFIPALSTDFPTGSMRSPCPGLRTLPRQVRLLLMTLPCQ